MRKLQKQRKSSKTRKILIGTLVAGLTLLPACRTPNLNQFKNKQPMVDNMENKEDLSKIIPVKKGEKKEEPKEKMKFEKHEALPPQLIKEPVGPKKLPPLPEQVY